MTIKYPNFYNLVIGPSASGKSTIAQELYRKIQNQVSTIIIDGIIYVIYLIINMVTMLYLEARLQKDI